jgi:PPK2 family polyphosphate:nucleotide phosphotransferase
MFTGPESSHRVPFDGSFRLRAVSTEPPVAGGRKGHGLALEEAVGQLAELQGRLYASNRASVLLMFQAMDAAGKDGTIQAVLSGVNPAGCQVFAFKAPSDQELDHDFLWRHAVCLPERGRIGIFNRSWYEEVLIVRVHPEYLGRQRLPWQPTGEALWTERFESIVDFERHLARNGTAILKFFLHVSKDEQRRRLLSRIEDPRKNWKVAPADVYERARWDDYQAAYEAALGATSRPWAPWYAIPADDKQYMRRAVAEIVVQAIRGLPLDPPLDPHTSARLEEAKRALAAELESGAVRPKGRAEGRGK